MDINDAERYAVAALFTLALHSTHVESGVDRNGNSLSESDIAWGCPSEELFDEQLLSQVPLKLPQELLEVFWGFDCMAPAGLAPRLYTWLKVPRKAWPGLLRMPDLAGCAGSPEAVEAFVTLVRRYSAFLDPNLDFTTGQASRLQQHFSMPAAIEEQDDEQQQQQGAGGAAAASTTSPSSKAQADSSSSREQQHPADAALKATKHGAAAAGMPASEAVAAAAASITAAAIAAEADTGDVPGRQGSFPGAAATHAVSTAAASGSSSDAGAAAPTAAAADAGLTGPEADGAQQPCAAACARVSSAAVASFDELHEAVDLLPKEADEGTVVPAATFTPADNYRHTTSHKAVLALYELIGGCLANNTEQDMEPLFAMAAREAETAPFAAAAAKGNKKALQQFMQQQQQAGPGSGSSAQQQQQQQQQQRQGEAAAAAAAAAGGVEEPRPAAAWFPSAGTGDQPTTETAASGSNTSKGVAAGSGGGAASSGQQQQQQALQPQEPKQQQQPSQQQQVQGLASIQWYDARARVAVKRVAHWLRVPWPQVRAFEQMWSMQALSLDAASPQPKYEASSRAIQYLKVGAAAVGGGALLAVTGGLAAPAIAAGLGAAVSLAHGGAAVAAAVSGFAGSTAGTAAVTGLFGAWGASVGGGSAGRLYGEVTEFGFWDLSQSIYVDGKGPQQQQQELKEDQQEQQEQGPDLGCKDCVASAGARGSVLKAEGSKESAAADSGQLAQAEESPAAALQPPQPQQQPSFLHRLFSSKPEATAAASSSSSDNAAAKGTAAGAAAGAAAAAVAGSSKPPSSPAATPPGGSSSSKGAGSVKQAPLSPSSLHHHQQQQQQSAGSEGLSRKSPLHMFGWGSKSADEEDGPAPRVRSTAIRLCDDAFNTDSDEDADEFYEEYLGHQGSAGGHTPRGSGAQKGAGPHTPKAPQQQPGSTTPKQQQQQPLQQQAQVSGSPEVQQQQQAPRQQAVQELRAVEVQDDPLSSATAAAAVTAGMDAGTGALGLGAAAGAKGADSPQQQPSQQQEQAAATCKDVAPPTADSNANTSAATTAAAAAGAAAGSGGAAAAAAAAASGGGVLSGLFSRKAPPPPVYVPLLPTPVNLKHRDETRMALTIAVNGCCVESMEDFVRPWDHLPSGDCDRFALVWESACLKELGGALTSFLAQQALTQVAQKSIQTFLYTGLVGALALPMTLTTAMKVAFGSKWLVALRRAQAAGKMLAMQLVQGCHGGRPVTLIGCSMGARLVFHCLLELSRLGLRGCVENVILLGAPLSCRPDRWCAARSVVAGRLINGYSVNDWTLGLLYRVHSSSSIWLQAAGMYKVEVPGVENINLSRLVAAHGDYLTSMEDVLEAINMHDT